MAELVFHKAQIGAQSGTMAAVGASVAATAILPVTEIITPELDRGAVYPKEDYGVNIANHGGRGYTGVRAASWSATGELTFEQFHKLLDMHWAGGVVASGSNPYTRLVLLEKAASTLIPYTIETGSETSQDQYELVGCVIDELTLGFDALAAPGASPWTYEASGLAVDRVVAAMTGSLTSPAVETLQGHLTTWKEGSTATAFASLSEIAASLIQFSITTRRSLVIRPYGGTGDPAARIGYSEKTNGEFSAMIAIGASTKTAVHDVYNQAGGVLGERRWRISVDGAGTNQADLDMRVGFMQVDRGDRDGEATYDITGEIVDDATLGGAAQWTIVNSIA